MSELARLTIRAEPDGLALTTSNLKDLTKATAEAEKAADKLAKSSTDAGGRISNLATPIRKASVETADFLAKAKATEAQLRAQSQAAVQTAAAMDGQLVAAARTAAKALTALTTESAASGAAMKGLISGGLAGAGEFAAAFIPGGVIAGAITYGLTKLVEYFTRTRDELKKTQEEFKERTDKMRQSADALGLTKEAFGVQQELDQLKARLAAAQNPAMGVFDLGAAKDRRTLPDQIKVLEDRLNKLRTDITTIPAQYAPRNVTPTVTVTADAPGYVSPDEERRLRDGRKRAADALQAMADAAEEESIGIREFNRMRAAQRQKRADAVNNSPSFEGFLQQSTAEWLVKLGAEQRESLRRASFALQEEARRQSEQIAQALISGLQNTFSTGISSILTNGIKGIADFGRAIKDTVLRAFSEILASAITRRLITLLPSISGGGSAGASVASAGGAIGSAVSLGGLFRRGASDAQIAADPFALPSGKPSAAGAGILAAVGGFGVGNMVGQKFGTASGMLAGAATGAVLGTIVPGIGNLVGGIIGGAAGLIGGALGGAAKRKAERQLADQVKSYSDSLTVRSLQAAGDSFEAGKLELQLKQKAEMDAAVKQFGRNSTLIAQLARVQSAETAAYLEANGPNALGAGTYMAPAGYSVNNSRFVAGNPYATGPSATGRMLTFTGPITIEVPAGTTEQQARAILTEFDRLNRAQGNAFGAIPRVN